MNAKQLSQRWTRRDVSLGLYARTIEGGILRLIGIGRKWIRLMASDGKILEVEKVQNVARDGSEL